MALKMFYRGPSSRLETLIEKIQQNKEDVYSSHTSSSFSPSLSDGVATPNSVMHDTENNHQIREDDEDNEREHIAKKLKLSSNEQKTDRKCISGDDGVQSNGDGTYHCQFCDKSFPRLGYLKKHEQSHAEHMPFKCDYCARLFKHKRSRDRHTKLHTGDRRYRCPHCEAAFSRSDHLKIHMKTHDNQKPFQCTVCNRGYNTAAALTSHMQNHKKQAALLGASNMNYSPRSTGSGSSTGSIQKRKSAVVDHSAYSDYFNARKATNSSSILYCVYCTKTDFQTLDQLHGHIQSMHSAALRETASAHPNAVDALQLCCEFCTMKFPTIQIMFHHIRTTHIDRVNSPNSYIEHLNRISAYGKLGSAFSLNDSHRERYDEAPPSQTIKTEKPSPKSEKDIEKSDMPVNIKQEEQEIPTDLSKKPNKDDSNKGQHESNSTSPPSGSFLCNQCNAALSDFESFRNHLKSHLSQGMGSYSCQHCGVTLTDQLDYDRHIVSHFMISNSEFYCNFNCNKTFSKADDLQKHLFDTHAQSLFKCSICAELFETKVAIQVHFAVAHSNEVKVYRCSACMDMFKSEVDIKHHVKTRHSSIGSVQCIFCRTMCASELEMHFHLASHARQFRCPVCPKSFHVEFLLDRHMQTYHTVKDQNYHYKSASSAAANNNNNIIDYQYRSAFGLSNKFYNPLQIDTNANKTPSNLYGFYDSMGKSRYEVGAKNILEIYNTELASKLYISDGHSDRSLYGPTTAKANFYNSTSPRSTTKNHDKVSAFVSQELDGKSGLSSAAESNLTCGICEKNDFNSEAEVHTHRKVSHNIKTGVSLRCAYCNGNFRSRNELENHMKTTHNTTGKHKCLICDEIFPSPAVLAEHKLSHSQVGPSGKCSRCPVPLPDVTTFKNHMAEHGSVDIPVQCICCRQTLNSEFEVGLHARFHTKTTETEDKTCALCLDILPQASEAKVCEKCFKKHNFSNKFQNFTVPDHLRELDHRCNICKIYLHSTTKLQEHLIEHSFKGCEERGYSCYICSAVFTIPSGLQMHMSEHGAGSKPYDCNLCKSKFFFRAELENHLINHENGRIKVKEPEYSAITNCTSGNVIAENVPHKVVPKTEIHDEEEEYIEVEKLVESGSCNQENVDQEK